MSGDPSDPPLASGDRAERAAAAVTPSAAAAHRLLGAAHAAPPGVGEWIGPYELVEEIARGGHSAVFRARQHAPVARELALKVLVAAAPSANVAARFAREQRLVARLRHPGIVPLIDAGETGPAGMAVPWFAMPLVEGEAVDRWCRRHQASRTVRLRILEHTARAVGAAHAVGIVHRDLKPGNILVSGPEADPQVSVIDFGVAKLLEPDPEGDGMLPTRVGGIVGTPEFMSPEQANLDTDRISPPSDVYALGLVACVLLADALPGAEPTLGAFVPMGERLRAAVDRTVPPVSRLSGDRAFRGEVDWIVAKCCAREISERYANATALADDLARLREGVPIVAAPKDSGYAVTFALRKYRAQLIGVVVAVATVVGALANDSARQRERADLEAARTGRLTALLEKTRKDLIPLTGRTRGDVVDETKAIPLLEMMRAINLELLGPDADETQQSTLNLARAYDRVDRFEDSEVLYRTMLELALANDRRLGDQAFLRTMLAGSLRQQVPPKSGEARQLLEAARAYWAPMEKPPYALCNLLLEFSMLAGVEGDRAEQLDLLEQGIACVETNASRSSFRRNEAWGFKADYFREIGDFAQARDWYAKALAGREESNDPTVRVWVGAWNGELLWMAREEARRAGGTLDPAREARFQEIVRSFQERDPKNPRIGRWIDPDPCRATEAP